MRRSHPRWILSIRGFPLPLGAHCQNPWQHQLDSMRLILQSKSCYKIMFDACAGRHDPVAPVVGRSFLRTGKSCRTLDGYFVWDGDGSRPAAQGTQVTFGMDFRTDPLPSDSPFVFPAPYLLVPSVPLTFPLASHVSFTLRGERICNRFSPTSNVGCLSTPTRRNSRAAGPLPHPPICPSRTAPMRTLAHSGRGGLRTSERRTPHGSPGMSPGSLSTSRLTSSQRPWRPRTLRQAWPVPADGQQKRI